MIKKCFLIAAFALLEAQCARAQTFSLVSYPITTANVERKDMQKHGMCAVTAVGIPVASLGLVAIIVGAFDALGENGPGSGSYSAQIQSQKLEKQSQAFLFGGAWP